MNENEVKQIVRQFLSQWGFQVKDLEPRPNLPTPDFEVTGSRDSYTMELKIKGDDPEEIRKKGEELLRGGIVGTFTPVGPRNTLGGLIREGVEQMKAWDPEHEKYRVIWLHSSGKDSELHNRRFQATLFGMETLTSLSVPHLLTCYYFHDSAFYRWRNELDGAMLSYAYDDKLQAQLCINTLSDRLEQFRNSKLVESIFNGLLDPDVLDGLEKGAMIADCDIDRKDSEKVLSYLQGKYGLDHLQAIPMNKVRGEMLLDQEESD